MNSFELFWKNRVRVELHIGARIPHWSRAGRYDKDAAFTVNYADSNEVEIKLDNGKYRTITKKYFENIYNLWYDYIQKKIKRTALSKNNLQTTYIISILKKLIP